MRSNSHRGLKTDKQTAKKGNKMPTKKKAAKKMRDLKPSKDAKGGQHSTKPNPVISDKRRLLN